MSESRKPLNFAQRLKQGPPKPEPASRTTAVPEYRSTEASEKTGQESQENNTNITSLPEYRSTEVPQYRSAEAAEYTPPANRYYRKPNELSDAVDRTFTPSESKVYDQLYRLSHGFNRDTCRVRVAVLMERTGYRSDKTVRDALDGLEAKGWITRLDHRNSPLGDLYRVHTQTTGVPQYRSTEAENTAVLKSKTTGELNTDLKNKDQINDDEAFADFVSTLKQLTRDITGKQSTKADAVRWHELAEVISTEARIAAGRTSVSNMPAFLAEHLRRRLFKKDKAQLEAEAGSAPIAKAEPEVDASKCPDCFGTGMYYPEGFEKGVAKCTHQRLTVAESSEGT
jgi:hypothetical protein